MTNDKFYYWAFKLAYFVERSISYHPSKFQPSGMSGLNCKGGGGRVSNFTVVYGDQKAQCF